MTTKIMNASINVIGVFIDQLIPVNESFVKFNIVEASFRSNCREFAVAHENRKLLHVIIFDTLSERMINREELDKLVDKTDFLNCVIPYLSWDNQEIAKQVIELYTNVEPPSNSSLYCWATSEINQKGIAAGSKTIQLLSNQEGKINLQTLYTIKNLAYCQTMTTCSIPITLTLPLYNTIIESSPLQYYKTKTTVKAFLTVKFKGRIEDGQDTFCLRYCCEHDFFNDLKYTELVLYFENQPENIITLYHFDISNCDPQNHEVNEWSESIKEKYLSRVQKVLGLNRKLTPCMLVDIMCNYALTKRIDHLNHNLFTDKDERPGLCVEPFKRILNGVEMAESLLS
ncbi:predicted protein [Naegleria gruberi]|uniref:Predicted protein n=1 Tax=Naegleria gruberi TaxID=5762 RepID=D2VF24_NAEGR|nr:uncharacterized protein NAEGRDRAFT_49014 [Naegleria gruberi]EFC44701.1 predicted protein [Naegleria gruberi]|eukprot:XP_002677445.1 predicted protein [Naegleria gruberi strain NEG-M]